MAKITVYTKNGCPQCDMTKTVLLGEGIEFEAKNIDLMEEDEREITLEYIKEELRFSAMPVVVVEGKDAFSGFQPDRLQELKG